MASYNPKWAKEELEKRLASMGTGSSYKGISSYEDVDNSETVTVGGLAGVSSMTSRWYTTSGTPLTGTIGSGMTYSMSPGATIAYSMGVADSSGQTMTNKPVSLSPKEVLGGIQALLFLIQDLKHNN